MSITYPGTKPGSTESPDMNGGPRRAGERPLDLSMGTTAVLTEVAERLPTEAAAYEFLEELRWQGTPVCPHCGSEGNHVFLRPANGLSRTTNRGKQSERRVWKCRACKRQFSVITGTVMHGTHVPIRTWVLVTFEIAQNGSGPGERDVQRRYGLSSKSAHFLLQRIRDDLRRPPDDSLFVAIAGRSPEPAAASLGVPQMGMPSDATPPGEDASSSLGVISMW